MKFHHVIKGLILILSLVAIAYVLKVLNPGDLLSTSWVGNLAHEGGLHGVAVFVVAGAFFTALGFPRQVISFMGGYGFGLLYGSLMALVAVTLGCILTFFYSRLLGRSMLPPGLKSRISRMDHILDSNPFMMSVLLRFLPIGSNLITNLAAGISRIRALPFFTGSSLGYIPQTIIFALIGSGVHLDPILRIGIGTILFFISGGLGVYIYKRYRRQLSQGDPAAHVIDDELADPASMRLL